MLDRLMDEASTYGLMGEECPEVDTEIGIAEALINRFREAGMEDIADYWKGNLVIFGEL